MATRIAAWQTTCRPNMAHWWDLPTPADQTPSCDGRGDTECAVSNPAHREFLVTKEANKELREGHPGTGLEPAGHVVYSGTMEHDSGAAVRWRGRSEGRARHDFAGALLFAGPILFLALAPSASALPRDPHPLGRDLGRWRRHAHGARDRVRAARRGRDARCARPNGRLDRDAGLYADARRDARLRGDSHAEGRLRLGQLGDVRAGRLAIPPSSASPSSARKRPHRRGRTRAQPDRRRWHCA